MVLKHYPLGDARFGIRFLVNSNIYPVCQSLKNKLRVGAGQTVIAEYVPNFLFQMGMGGCCFCDGATPGSILLFWAVDFGLSLFLGLALGFLCVRVSLWGSLGVGWLLDFVFGIALGYESRGMASLGIFVRGCGFWGLGLWLFLSASE